MLKKYLKKLKAICFGYKTPKCVGVDLSLFSSKLIELVDDSLAITKYSLMDTKKKIFSSLEIINIEQSAEHISHQWGVLNPDAKSVAISISHNSIIVKEFEIPNIPNKYKQYDHIKNLISADIAIDEIDFDYTTTIQNDKIIAKVVIGKKEKLEEYLAMVQMAGLNLAAIDVDSMAVAGLLGELIYRYQINQSTIFLDVGSEFIRAYVFVGSKYVIYRDLNCNINQALFDVWLNISDQEQIDYNRLYKYLADNIVEAQKVTDFVLEQYDLLFNTLKNSLLLEKQISLSPQSAVYLFGGNSLLPGFKEKLSNKHSGEVNFISDLLPENKHIPQDKLLRLVTAMSLAMWGN
jgi:Tfp pilus assembly PilM family ATPase